MPRPLAASAVAVAVLVAAAGLAGCGGGSGGGTDSRATTTTDGSLSTAGLGGSAGQYQTQLVGQALTTADLEALVRTLVSLRADPVHVPGIRLPPLPALEATP